ncbi:folate ECF transporter [Spirochaetia bacterium]|nr:folate ECF transporter [Spirochaetia bacterium]
MPKIKKIVLSALLLAILIVVERLVSVQTPILRISFAYVPIMLSAILLGPAYSAGIAAVGDIIGALLFPKGAFFPGFTLSAFLTGLTYGLLLYNTKNNKAFFIRLIISCALVLIFVHIGLTSLWLVITVKKAFLAFASVRIISAAVLWPVQVGTIFVLKLFLDKPIQQFLIGDTHNDSD